MNINQVKYCSAKLFSDLRSGEIFLYEGHVLMKIDPVTENEDSVRLSDGVIYYLGQKAMVALPISCELLITVV